jgi:hypothetical protein
VRASARVNRTAVSVRAPSGLVGAQLPGGIITLSMT